MTQPPRLLISGRETRFVTANVAEDLRRVVIEHAFLVEAVDQAADGIVITDLGGNIQIVKLSADSLLSVINDILNFSRWRLER